MKSRTQTYSPSHLITLAEIATAIAIARGTAGLEELHWLAQQAANGLLTAHLYPQHQPWQNGNITNSDGKQAHNSAGISRYGKSASNPVGIWRTLGTKAMLAYRGDKDASTTRQQHPHGQCCRLCVRTHTAAHVERDSSRSLARKRSDPSPVPPSGVGREAPRYPQRKFQSVKS